MNKTKIKTYKRVRKEVCDKYDVAEDFINSITKDICSQEKLYAEKVIYFLCFLDSFFSSKIVYGVKRFLFIKLFDAS